MSIATDDIRELRDITFPNKQAWCERHGYVWAGVTKTMDASRPPPWSKIKLIMKLCEMSPGDWAFWSDADSVVSHVESDCR